MFWCFFSVFRAKKKMKTLLASADLFVCIIMLKDTIEEEVRMELSWLVLRLGRGGGTQMAEEKVK